MHTSDIHVQVVSKCIKTAFSIAFSITCRKLTRILINHDDGHRNCCIACFMCTLLEFTRLCQQWGAHDWSWLAAFRADMTLYKGEIEMFRKLLQHERQRLKSSEKDRVSVWDFFQLLWLMLFTMILFVSSSLASKLTSAATVGQCIHSPRR